MTTNTFYLDKEHAKVIHQLLCERMEEIFSPFDNDKNWEATEELFGFFNTLSICFSTSTTKEVCL